MVNEKYLKIDVQEVQTAIQQMIADFPEMEEDAQLLADSIEGETDFHKIMSRLLDIQLDASTMAKAVKERETDLKARRERLEATVDSYKAMMLQLMKAAQQDKVTLPEATISVTKPRTSVNVIDVDALEQPFVRFKREADKKLIATAIENGIVVHGAELVQGEPSISIRTK